MARHPKAGSADYGFFPKKTTAMRVHKVKVNGGKVRKLSKALTRDQKMVDIAFKAGFEAGYKAGLAKAEFDAADHDYAKGT